MPIIGAAMAELHDKTEPQHVSVREFRGNLTSFLRQVLQGHLFLITSRNQVLAEVRPPSKVEQSRR